MRSLLAFGLVRHKIIVDGFLSYCVAVSSFLVLGVRNEVNILNSIYIYNSVYRVVFVAVTAVTTKYWVECLSSGVCSSMRMFTVRIVGTSRAVHDLDDDIRTV